MVYSKTGDNEQLSTQRPILSGGQAPVHILDSSPAPWERLKNGATKTPSLSSEMGIKRGHKPILFPGFPFVPALGAAVYRLAAADKAGEDAEAAGTGGDGRGAAAGAFDDVGVVVNTPFFFIPNIPGYPPPFRFFGIMGTVIAELFSQFLVFFFHFSL